MSSKQIENILTAIVVIALIVGVSYFVIQNSSNYVAGSDLTVYPVQCDDWFPTNFNQNYTDNNSNEPKGSARNFQNCLQKRALERTAFKINKASSQVIEWNPGLTSHTFSTYKNCTIVNSNNWSCDDSLGPIILGFGSNDGIFFDTSYTHVLFVSRVEWNSINNGAPTAFNTNVPKK